MARKRIPSNAKAKDFAEGIGNDLREDIEGQLSVFINSVARDLASKEVSPVKTGFFASSWQVSKTSMPENNQAKINPWIGNRDYIAPRFKVPTKYKLNKPIYIGNRAKYTEKALMSPKSNVGAYILNGSGTFKEGLRQKVDRIFTDKRPNINIEGLDV
tara:strand:- start:4608 stop:5081 length:474 start_codon:yes stop_codon:yes gene_type:complete